MTTPPHRASELHPPLTTPPHRAPPILFLVIPPAAPGPSPPLCCCSRRQPRSSSSFAPRASTRACARGTAGSGRSLRAGNGGEAGRAHERGTAGKRAELKRGRRGGARARGARQSSHAGYLAVELTPPALVSANQPLKSTPELGANLGRRRWSRARRGSVPPSSPRSGSYNAHRAVAEALEHASPSLTNETTTKPRKRARGGVSAKLTCMSTAIYDVLYLP